MTSVRRLHRVRSFVVLLVSLMAVGLLLHIGATTVQAQGPLLDENFEYGDTPGDLTAVSGGNWVAHSGAGNGPVQYQTSSLSFPGYGSSGIGGSATFAGTGSEDVHRTFPDQTAGDVYYAALVNLSAATSTGTYFLHLSDGGTSNFRGRFFARDSSGTLQFGLSSSGSTGTYSDVPFAYNTTYLVVVKFNVTTGDSALYVLDTFSPTEPDTPLLTSTGTGYHMLAICIRQGANGPTGIVDGIRVATTWDEVVGNPPAFSISKSAPAQVSPGQTFTYTLEIVNGTGISTTGTIITDAVPAYATYVPGSASHGGQLLPGDIISWTVSGYFTAGLTISRTFQVVAAPTAGVDIVNNDYVVSASNWLTPAVGAPVTTTIIGVDLSVNKAGPADPLWPGDTVIYTITLSFVGSEPALDVVLTDTFPADFVYAAHEVYPTMNCTPTPVSMVCATPTLTQSGWLVITGTVAAAPSGYVLINEVQIAASNDGVVGNNHDEYVNHLLMPIQEIQFVPDPANNDASPYVGQYAWVEGVVIAASDVFPTVNTRYFIQDPAGGPWSGLYIFNGGDKPPVAEGDWVRLYGLVDEYFGVTEINIRNNVGGIQQVISSGNPLPLPEVLPTGIYGPASPATAEAYESMLIEFRGAFVTNADLGYGEWAFDDGSGEAHADDWSQYLTYTPVLGDLYGFIRGIGNYSYSEYKLVPRYDADVDLDYLVTFVYHDVEDVAYTGEEVYLAGSFNGWDPNATPMTPNGDYSLFTVDVAVDEAGDYYYKYIVKSGGDQWDWLNTSDRQVKVASHLTVDDYRRVSVGYAHLMDPPTITILLGETTPPISGEVYIQNVTNPAGVGRAVWAELGYGVEADPALWTWTDLTFTGAQNGNNDIYTGTLTPLATGVYSYAVRFDGNRGPGNPNAGWEYGDLKGVWPGNPFDVGQAGVLTVLAPHLSIAKAVAPQAGVGLGSVVTYTIVLENSGNLDALGVIMTDVLPVEVNFGGWVQQNGAIQANDVLTWTGDVTAGVQLTFIFTATVGDDEAFYGRTVTNTASFVSDNAGSGSGAAAFVIPAPEKYYVYLPIVVKGQ